MQLQTEKLELLRASMVENSIDACILTGSDPHLGEYIPEHWQIIPWLTGFTGSAATVVITGSFAGLWTDSRYFIQAREQLKGTGFSFMEPLSTGKDSLTEWLNENLKAGQKVGIDGRTISISRLRRFEKIFAFGSALYEDIDLVSELWTDRPQISGSQAFEHNIAFCGKERKLKISEVREEMKKISVNYHLLTSLDDIMWLLNIRGSDVKYSPLLTSFAIIGEEQILLFADENKVPLKMARDFDALDIVMLPYEDAAGMLSTLQSGETVLLNPETTSATLFNSINKGMQIREEISIPSRLKSRKNKVEIENIETAMVRDGVALTRFFFWIEKNFGSVPMSELSLKEKLNVLRSEQENYLGPSFSPIVAFNHHGALPHFSVNAENDVIIAPDGILLVDSGSQYQEGTTDITRTIPTGKVTQRQKNDFTLVLKGHISLAQAKFPSGTKGFQLDLLARKSMWEHGINYGHGTGHGVGFCLNVHESPPSIGPSVTTGSKYPIEPGMLVSNEPAIYREGDYGIRTENLILCYEDEETESGKFLKFETMSLCYIDKTLINPNLLEKREITWLNEYHANVYEKISPLLSAEERVWLREKTAAL